MLVEYNGFFNRHILSKNIGKLECFVDREQLEYLGKCTGDWRIKRICARLMGLQFSGEKKIITCNSLPQFSSGKALSFSYSNNLIGMLFPVKNCSDKNLGLDVEEKFPDNEAHAIQEFFYRLDCLPDKKKKYDNHCMTMFWTIHEAFIKMFQDKWKLISILPEIFNKSKRDKKNFLHIMGEDICWQSFFFPPYWISMAFNTKSFPSVQISLIQ